jgi:Holliday junction resolvase-like predicted endonuclease
VALRPTDRREIDFIIQRGDELVVLEVKAALTVTRKDFTHIEDLRGRIPASNMESCFIREKM